MQWQLWLLETIELVIQKSSHIYNGVYQILETVINYGDDKYQRVQKVVTVNVEK